MSNSVFTLYDSNSQTPEDLLNAMTGSAGGISIVPGSVNYLGADEAVSSFAGFDFGGPVEMNQSGILLTSGDGAPALENTQAGYTQYHDDSGDAQFDMLAQEAFSGAGSTTDISILEFSFTVSDPDLKSISLDLIFGSEEFPNFIDSSYVDIAAVLVNDVNYGLFDGDPEKPLSVVGNNVDSGSLLDNGTGYSTGEQNYPFDTLYDIEYNGISPRLTVNIPLDGSAVYDVRIGVADTGDRALDSGLFVSNFSTGTSGAGGLLVNVEADPEGGELMPAGENTATFFTGGPGDDIMNGSTAADIYDLQAGGSNIIQGTLDKLDGDTVMGFSVDDVLSFLGSFFSLDDLTVTQGSAILDVDASGDGQSDATVTLEGDFEDAEFAVTQTQDGSEIIVNETEPVVPSILYLGNDATKVVVSGTYDLRPIKGVSYDAIEVVMDSADAAVSVASSIASSTTLTLHADGNYAYSVNTGEGTVDITHAGSGKLVAALPVDGDTLSTLPVRIGDGGTASAIELDPGDYSIVESTLPAPSAGAMQALDQFDSIADNGMLFGAEMPDFGGESTIPEAIDASLELTGVSDIGQDAMLV